MKKLALLLPLLFSSSIFAGESSQNVTTSLSLGIANGEKVAYDTELADGDLMIGYDFAYQYKFNNQWGIELGYNNSEPEGLLSAIDNIFNGDLELDSASSLRVAGVFTHSLSERSKFDFKLGVQQYDVKYTLSGDVPVPGSGNNTQNSIVHFSEDGAGLYIGMGWRYEFNSGLLLGAGIDYKDMDILDITNLNLSIGYHF